MKLIPTSPNREEYLACTPLVDYDHPQLAALAKQLGEGETDPLCPRPEVLPLRPG